MLAPGVNAYSSVLKDESGTRYSLPVLLLVVFSNSVVVSLLVEANTYSNLGQSTGSSALGPGVIASGALAWLLITDVFMVAVG